TAAPWPNWLKTPACRRGCSVCPWGPTNEPPRSSLRAFTAPRGGADLPWGGPAGGPSMNTTTIPGADTVGPVARWRALADFDWKPIALVPALMALALPAIGSGSTWLTLTVAGLAMGLIVFIIASGLTLVFGLMD